MIMPDKIYKPDKCLFYKTLLILKELKFLSNDCQIEELFDLVKDKMTTKDFIFCSHFIHSR